MERTVTIPMSSLGRMGDADARKAVAFYVLLYAGHRGRTVEDFTFSAIGGEVGVGRVYARRMLSVLQDMGLVSMYEEDGRSFIGFTWDGEGVGVPVREGDTPAVVGHVLIALSLAEGIRAKVSGCRDGARRDMFGLHMCTYHQVSSRYGVGNGAVVEVFRVGEERGIFRVKRLCHRWYDSVDGEAGDIRSRKGVSGYRRGDRVISQLSNLVVPKGDRFRVSGRYLRREPVEGIDMDEFSAKVGTPWKKYTYDKYPLES